MFGYDELDCGTWVSLHRCITGLLLSGPDHEASKQARSVGNNLISGLNRNKPMGHTVSILFNLDQSSYENT